MDQAQSEAMAAITDEEGPGDEREPHEAPSCTFVQGSDIAVRGAESEQGSPVGSGGPLGRKPIMTVQSVTEAYASGDGTFSSAARILGVAPQSLSRFLRHNPEVRKLLDEFREELLDVAEVKLQEAVENGERWAIQTVLKMRGGKRDYQTPGNAVTFNGPTKLVFTWGSPHDPSQADKQIEAEAEVVEPSCKQEE